MSCATCRYRDCVDDVSPCDKCADDLNSWPNYEPIGQAIPAAEPVEDMTDRYSSRPTGQRQTEQPDSTNPDSTNPDPTNPDHYKTPGPEVIELTEHLNFCRGNAVKYVCRAGKKDPNKEIEDLRKAIWYLNREIARLEKKASVSG